VTRVLITGGAGFIGLHLAEALAAQGHQVDVLDSFTRAVEDESLARLLESGSVRLIRRNLLEADALDDLEPAYDAVYHLAAIVGVAHVLERPAAVLRDNVEIHGRVLSFAARREPPPRLVFASTSEVYAGTLEHFGLPLPTPETAPLAVPSLAEPRSAYMLSKLYGEAMCHHWGGPFTIVRPHNVYGPRMGLSHVVPELLERAHEAPDGGRLEVYSVDHTRTFCYVEDAVEMLIRVASSPACEGETLNLGRERPELPIAELARAVVAVVGKTLEIVPLPPTPGSPARRCPDMSRMLNLTGFEARIELAEGIERTYAWYRKHVFAGGAVSAR
jgi:nucleoside-diphosphate-sugar epimerase